MTRRTLLQLSAAPLFLKGSASPVPMSLLGNAQIPTGAQTKRIYIALDDHTDYMWTADEEAYRQAFVETIDYYLDLADKTQMNPPAQQSRWNCDGSFWLWVYEKNKSTAEFRRLIERLRDGHFSVPLNALVSTYGGTPTEAVLRGMYYAGKIERRFDLKIELAVAMENQTLPYGLGSLWAGSGAKYSWKGICGCLTKIPQFGARPHDIYWWKGVDGSRILMKWNALTPGRSLMGNYLEAREPAKAIDFVTSDQAFKAAYPYSVIGIFGKGGDDLETLTDEFVRVAKEKTTPDREVIVSNMVDFFVDFEKSYGKGLPNFSASFGNEWDLYIASIAEISGRVRRAVENLRAAEAMASIVSLTRPEFLNGRQTDRDQAWMALGLFWEHDWTADGPIARQERANWGRKLANQVESYIETLHSDAEFALGGLIRSSGQNKRFYVFNPLGWKRSGVADIPYNDLAPVHVIDISTGLETPSQIVVLPAEGNPSGQRCLRVQAEDLPSVGYKVYEIRSGEGQHFAPAASVIDGTIENTVYRLKVAGNGAIRSLIDKTKGDREFAGHALNDLGPDHGRVEVENAGPVSVTLMATADAPIAHVSRVTLFRNSSEIRIRNDINQNFDGTYSWDFTFNLKSPDVWHEELGAVIRAKLLSQGGQYSPTMSRLEWLTLNHFADMSGADGVGITLSNSDCAFMKLGDSSIVDGVSHLDVDTPKISVLAGGRIDGPSAGIPKQGGDSRFLQRFGLRTHTAFSPTEAMRFALEQQNPTVAEWIRPGGVYPEQSFSFVSVSNSNVLLWALKPADDGPERGLVARLWNLSTERQTYSLSLAPGLRSAKRVSHIETDIEALPLRDGKVTLEATGSQLQTVRVVPVKN